MAETYTYRPRRTLVIEVEVQSAMADEKLFAKTLDSLRAEGDIVHFGVSRAVRKAKRTKDACEIGPMRVRWADES